MRPIHGQYVIRRDQQVIYVKMLGMWNEEAAKIMCQEFQQEASKMSSKPWACLVDFQEWELGSAEVFKQIEKANIWCNENNQRLEAVVCSKRLQERLMSQAQGYMPLVESAYFPTLEDAASWIHLKGYPFDPKNLFC